jgi:hypothetical protein
MGFAHSVQPILRNSYLPFLRFREIRSPGSSFLLSFRSPIEEMAERREAGILSPSRPVTARHHVCEAWAIPCNRDGASRRSTVTVLGPVPALRLRSCLRYLNRVPNLPATVLRPAPGRHLPLRLQETLLESAPHERDFRHISTSAYRSQYWIDQVVAISLCV